MINIASRGSRTGPTTRRQSNHPEHGHPLRASHAQRI